MTIYGYARVSSTDQDLGIQTAALRAAGCNEVRGEKVSGTSIAGRAELRNLLDLIRQDDVLVVTRIDRLARSIADLARIVRELEAKGAALKATEQPIDTSSAGGRAFLQMLSAFSEFETAIRRGRQMEGIAAAKAAGVYKGRPPSIKPDAVAALKAEGLGANEIAKKLVGSAALLRIGRSGASEAVTHGATMWRTPLTVPPSYMRERKGFAAWVTQMTRRFEREIEAFNRLTARKGELAAAEEDARRGMALSLKAVGREEAFDAVNSAIDEVVARARVLEPANVSNRPSGSVERRSGSSRGFGARAAPVKAGEELSDATH